MNVLGFVLHKFRTRDAIRCPISQSLNKDYFMYLQENLI